jgi:hypothetical protein
MSRRGRFLRTVSLALIVTGQAACSSWHVESASPAQVLESHPGKVRVRRTDGTHLVLSHPHVVQDSLVGQVHGQPGAVALVEVDDVAVRRGSALKTGGLVFGILAAPVAALGLACALGADCHMGM